MKQNITARSLVTDLWDSMKGMLSTQVLQEFYVNVTRTIPRPLPHAVARGIIENYFTWEVQLIYPATLLRVPEFQERHQLSYWEAMIVAAAYEGKAKILFSEDLHHGPMIEGLRIVNPFLG